LGRGESEARGESKASRESEARYQDDIWLVPLISASHLLHSISQGVYLKDCVYNYLYFNPKSTKELQRQTKSEIEYGDGIYDSSRDDCLENAKPDGV